MAKSIRTSAFFAKQPDLSDTEYNPRLYAPTGVAVDPEDPGLDSALTQYEQVISEALTATADTVRQHNISRDMRDALYTLKENMLEGTGDVIPLMADKDAAFVAVSPEQHKELWQAHLDTSAYTLVTHDQQEIIDRLQQIRRECMRLAKVALESSIISQSEHNFLIKDCRGPIRFPKGTVMVKTHKPTYPGNPMVGASRLYLDTVNYLTTAWAKFLSVKLTPARDGIVNRIKDTADLIGRLSQHRFDRDCLLVTADIVDFYPSTKEADGENVISHFLPHGLVDVCLQASRLIHQSIYISTPCGIYKLDGRYGIGLAHSGEICDLDWSLVEQKALSSIPADQLAITLPFWERLVDDYFMVLQGSPELRQAVVQTIKTADPDRPLKVFSSTESVDFLDVTVYKGHQFHQTGRLDTKPYTKPSFTGMHLHYTSHHPQSTFDSILSGFHSRSLIASSDITVHRQCMNQRVRSFRGRGYPVNLLIRWFLQDTTRSEECFQQERERLLSKKQGSPQSERVIPLKLQYTPRTTALSSRLSVSRLQKSIQKASPALSRASLGKITVCNLRTANILEVNRPRGFYVQVRLDGSISQQRQE